MYTGLLYHTIPIALLTLNWFITLGWFTEIGFVLVYYRIPIEEKILIDLFGKEYLDYRKIVPPLGPGTGFLNKFIIIFKKKEEKI
jgi:protein-S-isoprenylcysteine O-methyltransferase Ste14